MSSPTPAPPGPATCPRCHRPIPAAAPLGACPHCLLAAGLPSAFGPADAEGLPPPAPAELAPEFPSLEILELLGRGGMGAVYKARQRDLDRLVALKILRPGLDADPGFAERFAREARALAQLNHPGIVTLFEFGRTAAGRYFILMEFVDGMNLRGLLDAGRLAPREALAIVPPLCDALQYAHDRGLVHRDIKPENILVDRLGRVKIADFGIARLAADPAAATTLNPAPSEGLTEVGKAIGTPAYMAPEQRQDPAAVDHRADLYALGVVLYQMLTGELPAPGQLQPPSRRVQIDVRLDEIVLRALEKDPALRYAAAREFKTHLETVTSTSAPASATAAPSATPFSAPSAATPSASSPSAALTQAAYGFSYRSRRTLFGLPLLHVATGLDPVTGRRRVARGIVAIGDIAQGFIALGGVAMGGFTFGGISLGAFSYGGLVLALFAIGGLGIGAIGAFAGLAIAPIALGGFALGWYAFGGSAIGAYVSAPGRHDPGAVAFFGSWARQFTEIAGITTLAAMGLGFALMFYAIEWARKRAVTTDAAASAVSTSPSPAPNPRGSFSPWIVFLVLFTAYVDWLVLSGGRLPERVASHFNVHGEADGWMSRLGYLSFAALVPFGLAAFIALVGWSLRWLPINIPRRDYWLAPERKTETAALLFRWMAVPACLLLVLFAEMHFAVVLANQTATPRLAASFLMVPALGFLVALMLWIVGLVLRLAEPDATAAKTRRQTWALLAAGFITLGLCAIPLRSFAALKTEAIAAAAAQSAWNLDVVATDHRAWPPQTLPPDRALPVAGAVLALLGSCETREPSTAENWSAAESAPRLRLDYPRAAEGNMPDAVILPLPFTGATSLWTRKGGKITRHSAFSSEKSEDIRRVFDTDAPPPPRHRFGDVRVIGLPRSRPVAYDFDQERFAHYVPSARSPNGIEASQDWHAEQGTDILADPDSASPGVLFLGTDLVEVTADLWDATADQAASFKGEPDQGLMVFLPAPRRGHSPHTRVYRTPQGGVVLVQILGADNAADITLRYKAILPATTSDQNAETAASTPLVVTLLDDGIPRINGVPLSREALQDVLAEQHRSNSGSGVEIRSSTTTPATSVTALLEACGTAGISRVKIAPPVSALDLPPIQDAHAWLLKIDRGDYAGSWQEGGAALRAGIGEQDWVKALLAARAPLGPVRTRRLTSSESATTLPGGPDGEHLVMTFSTRFAHKSEAVETVTFSRDADGSWRATGYFIR